jgi:hypothetical protein
MPTCFSDLSLMLMLDVRQAGVNKLTLASGSATNRGSADDLPAQNADGRARDSNRSDYEVCSQDYIA